MRIAVVAPSCRTTRETAAAVTALARRRHPGMELAFHPQCFASDGHFAGSDAQRTDALLEVANDPEVDAVWFARGGYGACRIAQAVMDGLELAAGDKRYLGYSDGGTLLAALYREGVGRVAHGPMANDMIRPGGEAAVARALDWLAGGGPEGWEAEALEPSLAEDPRPAAAFNLTILSQLLGTAFEPDLTGHVLMLEEVSEPTYRTDRAMFHITGSPAIRRVAGIRLGRVTQVPPNDPEFGSDAVAVVRDWCARSGIAWLGRAEIGHDADNRVAPFGAR